MRPVGIAWARLANPGSLKRQCFANRKSNSPLNWVLCVKFCKGGHGWLESCGLAELNFLVLFEIVHIEIAVGFEPVLVGLDG